MAELNINEINSDLTELEDRLVQFETNYTQTVWADGQQPAINAVNLSKIEGGIGSVNTYLNNGNSTNVSILSTTIKALRMEEDHRIKRDGEIATSLTNEENRAKKSENEIQLEIGDTIDEPDKTVTIEGGDVPTVYGQLNSLREDYQNLIGDEGDDAEKKVFIKVLVLDEANGNFFDSVESPTVHSRIQRTIEMFNDEIGDENDSSDADTVHGRIKKLEEFVGEYNDDANTLVNRGGEDVPTVNARIKGVENHIGNSSDASTANTIHGRIKKAEESIASQYTKLTNEYKSYTDNEINALHKDIKECSIEELNDATYKTITDHGSRIAANESNISKHESRIGANEGKIANHEVRIAKLEVDADYSILSKRIDDITLYNMNDTTESYTVILDGGELS